MLLNVSYNRPKIKAQIDNEVGFAYSLIERFKMKGIGSGKIFINSASIEIHNLLALDSYLNTCGIELRPKGIIVTFRSILETYALVIPYYKLNLYKGKSEEYSIYRDHYFIKIKANNPRIHKFMKKTLKYKNEYMNSINL